MYVRIVFQLSILELSCWLICSCMDARNDNPLVEAAAG